MPKAIKKRVSKKTGIKEEEVKSALVRALENIKSRKKLVSGLLSGAAVAVFMVIVTFYLFSEDSKKAYALEQEAYGYYYETNLEAPLTQEERWAKALELFKESAELKSTLSTQFYIGNSYFNLGDYDNAVVEYRKYIDQYGSKNVMLPLVYQKLASAFVKQGKSDEAFSILNELSRVNGGIFADTALVLEARLHEAGGKNEDAMSKYRELAERFPLSPWISEAKQKIKAEEEMTKEEIKEEVKEETAKPEGQTPEEPASEEAAE